MSCAEIEGHLALAAVGALEPADRGDMDRHLSTCTACTQLAAANADAVALLPLALEPVAPPARLRRNLMAQVYAESVPASGPGRFFNWRRLVTLIPSNRALTAAGAAALAAAVALAVWSTRPDERSYQLFGTPTERGVSGTLSFDPSQDTAVIDVRGLPQLAATAGSAPRVYEVWLIPGAGAPLPAGFLTHQPSGGTWTAVINADIRKYQTVAATVEPYGGSPGPTGAPVISGELHPS
jgi:anti-sigma-K factor RskA